MKYSTHIDKAAEPTIDSFSLVKAYHISDRMTDNNLWHVNTKKKMKNHTHNLFLHPLGDLYWEPRVKGPLVWIDNERAVDRLRYPSDECSDYRAPENSLRIHGCFWERCRIGIGKISAIFEGEQPNTQPLPRIHILMLLRLIFFPGPYL